MNLNGEIAYIWADGLREPRPLAFTVLGVGLFSRGNDLLQDVFVQVAVDTSAAQTVSVRLDRNGSLYRQGPSLQTNRDGEAVAWFEDVATGGNYVLKLVQPDGTIVASQTLDLSAPHFSVTTKSDKLYVGSAELPAGKRLKITVSKDGAVVATKRRNHKH